MGKIIYTLVYNRKAKLSKDGTAPIHIRAYLNGERKYFATEIKLRPDQWDAKKMRVKSNVANYIQINKYLRDEIDKLEKKEFEILNNKGDVTLNDICNVSKSEKNKFDFLKFYFDFYTKNKKIEPATKKAYGTVYNHLKEWQNGHIPFENITFKFLKEFENYCLNNGINQNTTGKYLKTIRAIVNAAINYGYMTLDKYPFRGFRIKSVNGHREYLTPQEIEKIESLDGLNPTHQKIKDMYLFAVYTGLRFSDVIRINIKHIQDIDGKKYLSLPYMKKTGEPLRIPIFLLFNGKAVELLEKYTDKDYFFDDYTAQYVNRELKKLAELAGIEKPITFKSARHTTATFLLYKGVSLSVIQKILGHTKISTTQIYAKVMDLTIENELKSVFN